MKNITPCFFMLCRDSTENECLEKGLFGDKQWLLPHLKSIKKGDIGFLLNVSKDQLLGIFAAEGEAKLNIDPNAWGGKFPVQVKVKLLGELQRIKKATDKLEKIIELKEIKRDPYPYKIPSKNTYGPEITEKVLSLFDTSELQRAAVPQPEEVGIFPETALEDVAGLNDVKDFVYQRIIAPFEDEEKAYSLGLRIGGGMLLFGPPGTGKTLIAMSIAKSIQAKFIDISPSVIVGFPGEAERRLENIFAALDKEPRAVVFLDEAEWILCKREDQTSSVMQRITPVLLAQLSRIFKQKTKPIVVIAATNKPQMIDPAFLRPGRFDRIFYIGLPDKNARKDIIKLQLRNRAHQIEDSDILEIAEKLEGYSGADIENIFEESAFKAFNRRKSGETRITKDDIVEVIERTPKSVTPNEEKLFKEWVKERGLKI
jgi:transitional endoplasmic reticulum ATPase